MSIIEEQQEEKIPKGKGFYITLAVCCAAVVAAAWSTYRSVNNIPNTLPSEDTHEQTPKIKKEEITKNKKTTAVQNPPTKNETAKNNPITKKNDKPIKKDVTPANPENRILAEEEENEENIQSVLSDSTQDFIVYPTNNNIIKEFSDGKPVYSKTLGDWRVHDGVDFRADRGTFVKSITGGVVKDIYNDPSYGTTIVIEHNAGFVGYYSGLGDTTLVNKGDTVKTGDDIGSINTVPVEISEEPHLHFMINKDGKFIDPILILDKETE